MLALDKADPNLNLVQFRLALARANIFFLRKEVRRLDNPRSRTNNNNDNCAAYSLTAHFIQY